MVAELAREPGSGILGLIAVLPAGERRGLRGLARRGAGARRGRLPAHPARDDRRGVADRRPSAPTCGRSGARACRSTCASWRGSCRSRSSWRGPARTRCWCSTTAGCPTSPAAALEPWRGGRRRRWRRCRTSSPSSRASSPTARRATATLGDGAAVGRARDRGLRARALPLGQRLAGGERRGGDLPALDRRVPRDPRRLSPRTRRRRWRTAPRSGSTASGSRLNCAFAIINLRMTPLGHTRVRRRRVRRASGPRPSARPRARAGSASRARRGSTRTSAGRWPPGMTETTAGWCSGNCSAAAISGTPCARQTASMRPTRSRIAGGAAS